MSKDDFLLKLPNTLTTYLYIWANYTPLGPIFAIKNVMGKNERSVYHLPS